MSASPQAKDVFFQALEIKVAEERARFLDTACRNDIGLRRRVDALLAAHDDPDSYLERPAAKFDVSATIDGDGSGTGLSDSSSHHGRFLPGTKLAGRYRIVSLLGRGGMGEVYRADDLKLGQTVALKFLPSELANDEKRLEYFHNEVRLARQISHPNVCRVFDIGEVDGHQFISMEYIDGEDLKALLHRIGRMPKDKGVQIAQEICSGLAAAHAKGVLHRDLKPANIMIDGQGQVRITDFGLASVSVDGENVVGMSGTPAYMAPEQLLRGQASVQSDIYSLGLILYELFAGEPVHQATSLRDLQQIHSDSSRAKNLSQVIDDVEPAVARVVDRCLEADPVERPRSVNHVRAGLPGGDPLAAVLAAGDTPSPELIMSAGGHAEISRRLVIGCVVATAISMIVFLPFSNRSLLVNQLEFPYSPEVLKYKAQTVLRELGFTERPHETAFGVDVEEAVELDELVAGKSTDINSILVLPSIHFWYRESLEEMSVDSFWGSGVWIGRGQVRSSVPSVSKPGSLAVSLDRRGWLRSFQYSADASVLSESEPPNPSWTAWFSKERIGFDLSDLAAADVLHAPSCAFDRVQAWKGRIPNTTEDVYVHAASIRGRPAYLEIVPHTDVDSLESGSIGDEGNVFRWRLAMGLFAIFLSLNCVAIALAIRSIRSGRADRKGAFRLAAFVFLVNMLAWACVCRHVAHPGEYPQLMMGIASSLQISAMIWVFYLAIEPFGRREWPELLIGWRRLLDGRWSDPRIGRDILVGVTVGAITLGTCTAARLTGAFRPIPPFGLLGIRDVIDQIVTHETLNLVMTLSTLLLLLVARKLTGSQWKAACLMFIVLFGYWLFRHQMPMIGLAFGAINLALRLFVLIRFGLLAYVLVEMRTIVSVDSPITMNTDAFHFSHGLAGLIIYLGLAVYGVYIATDRGATLQPRNVG